MNIPGGWELVLILLVFMLLFGAKRMPDAARSLGRSLRILKAETKGLRDDDGDGYDDRTGTPMSGSRTDGDGYDDRTGTPLSGSRTDGESR